MYEHNIKLVLAYDGKHYHGWQRQKSESTIQSVIEEKIQVMVGDPVNVVASGRTDAGVHALNQVCNFITRSNIDPEAIRKGLNSLLPHDILVKDAKYVPLEFHARYSAKSKIYDYRVLNQGYPDIFLRHYVWHIRPPLDIKEIKRCLPLLLGTHDFSSFKSSGSENTNPVRSITRAEIHGPEHGRLYFIVEADGFLRHMVRNMVGTLAEVGLGKINFRDFGKILEAKDRRSAGIKAPPQGLFLVNVRY